MFYFSGLARFVSGDMIERPVQELARDGIAHGSQGYISFLSPQVYLPNRALFLQPAAVEGPSLLSAGQGTTQPGASSAQDGAEDLMDFKDKFFRGERIECRPRRVRWFTDSFFPWLHPLDRNGWQWPRIRAEVESEVREACSEFVCDRSTCGCFGNCGSQGIEDLKLHALPYNPGFGSGTTFPQNGEVERQLRQLGLKFKDFGWVFGITWGRYEYSVTCRCKCGDPSTDV